MIRAPEQIVSDFLSEVADRETLSGHNGELDWLIEDARTAQTAWRTLLSIRDMAQPVPPQEAWQDISTAPKDGTVVMVWYGQGFAHGKFSSKAKYAYWADDGWIIEGVGGNVAPQPTHWMPLPEPPQDKGPTQ